VLSLTLLILLITLNSVRLEATTAYFEEKTIEDVDDWFIGSQKVNFTDTFKSNIYFTFGNTTLGFGTYLTFESKIDAPLNLTGYLSKKIKEGIAELGVQVKGAEGNIILGVNGTLLIAINETIMPIEFEQEQIDSITNFDSIIGENLNLTINVNPLNFEIPTTDILPSDLLIDTIIVSIQPEMYLVGSISLSAEVMNETLTWETGDEIYFTETSVEKDLSSYSFDIKDISYNFSDVRAVITAIAREITFTNQLIGEIYSTTFEVELSQANSTTTGSGADELTIFLLNSLFQIEDQEIVISIEDVSFSLISTLVATVFLTSTYLFLKRKRKR